MERSRYVVIKRYMSNTISGCYECCLKKGTGTILGVVNIFLIQIYENHYYEI